VLDLDRLRTGLVVSETTWPTDLTGYEGRFTRCIDQNVAVAKIVTEQIRGCTPTGAERQLSSEGSRSFNNSRP